MVLAQWPNIRGCLLTAVILHCRYHSIAYESYTCSLQIFLQVPTIWCSIFQGIKSYKPEQAMDDGASTTCPGTSHSGFPLNQLPTTIKGATQNKHTNSCAPSNNNKNKTWIHLVERWQHNIWQNPQSTYFGKKIKKIYICVKKISHLLISSMHRMITVVINSKFS